MRSVANRDGREGEELKPTEQLQEVPALLRWHSMRDPSHVQKVRRPILHRDQQKSQSSAEEGQVENHLEQPAERAAGPEELEAGPAVFLSGEAGVLDAPEVRQASHQEPDEKNPPSRRLLHQEYPEEDAVR